MRLLILLFFFVLTAEFFTQSVYEIQTDEKSGKPMLVGLVTRTEIQKTVFNDWWSEQYNKYEVDILAADELIPFIENVTIKIVAASWCGDSRETIPHLFKVLDYIAFPEKDIEMIFVNRNKTGLAGEVNGLKIDFVPTIIFYRSNTEIGRIIELPYESLELDMLSILFEPSE